MSDRPLVVVICTPFLSRRYGGSATALDAAEVLLRLGHDVHVVLSKDSVLLRLMRQQVSNVTVLPLSRLHVGSSRSQVPRRRQLREEVLGPPGTRAVVTRAVRASLKLPLKMSETRWHRRTVLQLMEHADVIVDAGAGLPDEVLSTLRARTEVATVLNHAGSVEAVESHFVSDATRSLSPSARQRQYLDHVGRYDWLLFQSADAVEELAQRDESMVSRALVLPPSCQEYEVLASRALPSPFAPDRRAIINIGTIQRRKAQLLSLEAFAAVARTHPDIDLHLLGGIVEPDYAEDIRYRSEELALSERVIVHGHRDDHLRFLSHGDIMIHTSMAEGVSRAIREAMAVGIPIVASAIPGTSDALTDQISALLIQPGAVGGFACALQRLLDEEGLGATIASGARRDYIQRYSWSSYVLGWDSLLRKLCDS